MNSNRYPYPYPVAPWTPPAASAGFSRADGQEFLKGALMTAGLAALQDSPDLQRKSTRRRVLRRALQGGAALSAANSAARSLAQGRPGQALVAASLGAAGVYLIERLLGDATPGAGHPTLENIDG